MKESDFINQNKLKWTEVEKNLTKKDVSPSDTSKLFIQIADDLSYARTFYKNRSVKIYLNEIAKFLFNDINKTKQNYFKSFTEFWKTGLPLVMYVSRRSMLISFLVFVSCFILGVVTSRYDPEFCKSILSSNYINMTNENITKGDPMAVYKSNTELETFLPIFVNNIRIDFITFFSGILMSIGTLFIMVVNGVMVGVFQYFFITKGLFWESFLAIWTHGTLEISAIILSGGAGLTLGSGLLFPGTHARFTAFKNSGMNGLKIIIGVAPITLIAAFIEGFLTRHTEIPDIIRFSFILLSLSFVLIYFVWYPQYVAKKYPNLNHLIDENPVYKNHRNFNPHEILEIDGLLKHSFKILFKNFKHFGGLIVALSIIVSIIISYDSINLFYENSNQIFAPVDYVNYLNYPLIGLISLASIIYLKFKNFVFLKKSISQHNDIDVKVLLLSLLSFFTIYACFIFIANNELKLFVFLLLPVFSFISSIIIHQNVSFIKGITLMGGLLNKQWSKFIVGAFFSFFISWILYIALCLATEYLYFENALVWILTDNELTAGKIKIGVSVFQISVGFLFYISFYSIYNSLLFYTLKEVNTAEHLIIKINHIKASK